MIPNKTIARYKNSGSDWGKWILSRSPRHSSQHLREIKEIFDSMNKHLPDEQRIGIIVNLHGAGA